MMSQPSDTRQPERQPFPLDVVQLPKGWVVVVHLEDGRTWQLLKPGWDEEPNAPYLFENPDQAWDFLRQLFLFCIKQQHAQYLKTDKILNCRQCGRVIRARFDQHCFECLKGNEFVLHQIWQGFYYMTGNEKDALDKMSLLLKIPADKFTTMPEAFRLLIRQNLAVYESLEKSRGRLAAPVPKSRPLSGMHSSRFIR